MAGATCPNKPGGHCRHHVIVHFTRPVLAPLLNPLCTVDRYEAAAQAYRVKVTGSTVEWFVTFEDDALGWLAHRWCIAFQTRLMRLDMRKYKHS